MPFSGDVHRQPAVPEHQVRERGVTRKRTSGMGEGDRHGQALVDSTRQVRAYKTLCPNAVSHPPPCTPLISAQFTEAALQQTIVVGKLQMGLS